MPEHISTPQPWQQLSLYVGQPAGPEEIFGDYYQVWKIYHAAYRRLLPGAVWAAMLMGRAVIPLTQRKKPLVKWKLYQTNPPSIEQVLAWQRQFHPRVWGAISGRHYRFLVLDFDGARGIETMQKLQIQPHVRTGSGGHHFYVEYPDDLDVRTWNAPKAPFLDAILPGTDIKANGGYAVFTGTSQKGSYQWLRPMWPDPCTPEIHGLLVQVINASRRSVRPVTNTSGHSASSSAGRVSGVRPNGHGTLISTLLSWAWKRAVSGRNHAGFELACQLRDNGCAQDEAQDALAQYAQGVGPNNQHGQYELYTVTEALASVAQAYSRQAREPWSLPPTSSPSAASSRSSPPPSLLGSPCSPLAGAPPSSSPPPPVGPRLVMPGSRGPGRRQILYQPPLTPIVEASLDALDRYYHADPQLFIRGNQLTEVVRDEQTRYHLRRIGVESMTAHLDRAVEYLEIRKHDLAPIFPPVLVVGQILARSADQLPFPPLIGIVKSPIMRPNGTVLERATRGYDGATRYFCAMDPAVALLGVPTAPNHAEVTAAVALLEELVCDVCFADPRHVYLANYIALLLTPLMRWMIDGNLPIFALDATKPRSGKGLLAAVAGILADGHQPIISTAPERGESGEWRKRITSYLLAGHNIIVIDNVVFSVSSAELCAMVTSRNYSDRVLGGNTIMTADPTTSIWIMTGNNLQPIGDLVKRCFWVRLDPQRNDPEKRTGFRHGAYDDFLNWVATNRAALLRALLTLVRAWMVAEQPKPIGLASLGGFDRWVQVVGGVMQHAGLKGFFQDPEQAYVDPDAEQWLPFLQSVGEVTYWTDFTVSDLVRIAQDVQWSGSRNVASNNAAKLRDNLPGELAKTVDTPKFGSELGYAFRRKRNAYYGPDNMHLAHTGKFTRDGAVLWQVRRGIQGPTAAATSTAPASASNSSTSSSASSISSSPAVGAVKHVSGETYVFDGQDWVEQV
jgi:hypothetical protein